MALTRVQDARAAAATTCAYGSNVTSGNLLVVCASASNFAAYTAPTDTRGNTYTLAGTPISAGGFNFPAIAIWYAVTGSGGANTVTVSQSSDAIAIFEFSGQHATPLDTTGSSGNTAATNPTANLTTGAADCVVVAYGWLNAASTWTSGTSGYTSRTSPQARALDEYLVGVGAAGAKTVDSNSNSNTAWLLSAAFKPSTVTNYTLTASVGSATAAGVAATLKFGRHIVATGGAATAAGLAATLKWAHKLTASPGSATAAGVAASVFKGYPLTASPGAATAAGVAATLKYGRHIVASSGSATAAGVAATVTRTTVLFGASGSATAVGQSAGLRKAYPLVAAGGSITAAGVNATLQLARNIVAAQGSATVAGLSADLIYSGSRIDYVLTAVSGSAVAQGLPADLLYVPATTSSGAGASGSAGRKKRRRFVQEPDLPAAKALVTALRRAIEPAAVPTYVLPPPVPYAAYQTVPDTRQLQAEQDDEDDIAILLMAL